MLKLITISCIIVASLNFQEVKGFNLIPSIPNPIPNIIPTSIPDIIKNPLPNIIKNPLPDIIKNPLPNITKNPLPDIIKNPLPNIIPSINSSIIGGSDIASLINDVKNGIESILEGALPKFPDLSPCIRLPNEGLEIITIVSSILNSCLITEPTSANLTKLSNLANGVRKNLTEDAQKILQCLQQCPLNIASCLNGTNGLAKVNINELIGVALSDSLSVFPLSLIKSLPVCIETLADDLNLKLLIEFVTDTGHCIQSIITIIKIIRGLI